VHGHGGDYADGDKDNDSDGTFAHIIFISFAERCLVTQISILTRKLRKKWTIKFPSSSDDLRVEIMSRVNRRHDAGGIKRITHWAYFIAS
jgi:hypothetical protein